MDANKVKNELTKRFSAPLLEFYERRIIFWFDPEQEFSAQVEELCPDGVKLVKLDGNNNFAVKKLLSEDDLENNYLVYNPLSYSDIKDDWLIDIELYSEEFRADLISIRLQDLNMEDKPAYRKALKAYSKFFENKERVAKLTSFNSTYSSVGQLHIDVLSVLSGSSVNSASGVISTLLMSGLDLDDNQVIENIRKFGNEAVLWELVKSYTGYLYSGDSSLIPLAAHVLLTALSVTMKASDLSGLEKLISTKHQQLCYELVTEWMHSENDDDLYEIAREVERSYNLVSRFDKLEVEDLVGSECFPCINECILRKYMVEISENVIKAEDIISTVEKRRTLKWYKRVRYYYDGLLQVASIQQFYQANAGGFHIADYTKLWKEYCNNYCKMDYYYRQFHMAFGRSLKESSTVLEDLYKNVADYVENLYKNWYLSVLGKQWTSLIKDEICNDSRLSSIPNQEDFYSNRVKPLISSGRVYVIISDALRYEVGVELTNALLKETKGTAKISSMQAVFPSVTKLGMAALLPHDSLEFTKEADVLCDDVSTEGTANRDKILKVENSGNVAITYKELLSMKQAERREKVSNAQVVYIYHNAIDAVGDKLATEDQVFDACEQAITEIKNLIRVITNDLSGVNIIITSDHGFLYSYKPLKESDKAEKNLISGYIVELDRRYVVADNDCKAEHMMNVSMNRFSSYLKAFTPMDNIRMKKSGGGMNYVHGGMSLQESVVPVIEFKNMRASSKKFVDVTKVLLQLISQSRKVSNSIFSLDFYQKEAVGGKVTAAKYDIFMADAAGTVVSDKKTIIADKTSTNGSDRVFRVRFTLKSMDYDKTATYYLTIVDKDTSEVVEKIEFTIDIAFVNDFDF